MHLTALGLDITFFTTNLSTKGNLSKRPANRYVTEFCQLFKAQNLLTLDALRFYRNFKNLRQYRILSVLNF